MFKISTIDANDQLLEVELDGETFFIRLSWNSEAEQWAMEVQNYNQETLVAGIVVVPNVLLLARFHYLPLPAGELMALVLGDTAGIPREGFLNGLASLIYVPAAEIR
ncbi:phage baseplate plug family protein [Stenotrophomonas maltophilia]|uniref:phage baseplate plug family protein n=1 Tax=Stenotrophomonas maltophilia TaxID=40324 RepID=UPI00201D098D|nr:hypothetical protein [Stenotrophomonas maltophilia]UQY97311.1 hypothetical protein LZ605_08110 [Stenotrophomonas maltophilia]